MDNEQQTTTETTPTEAVDNPTEGDIPETANILDRADATAKRIEEANKKTEELITRQEAIAARMLLAGKTDAGQTNTDPKILEQTKADEEAAEIIKRFKTS